MQVPIIALDEESLKGELREVVRSTAEEVVNGILDAQADELVNAGKYEPRTSGRRTGAATTCGGLLTRAGKIEVSVPKLRGARFTTEVIKRYRRHEPGIEEAMMGTRFLGVPTRNVEEVTNVLWEEGVSAGMVSNLDKDAYRRLYEWRTRPLACEHA